MALLDPINNYCERTGEGLLSEPINAISNIAFFIAAWLLYKAYRANGRKDPQSTTLIIILAVVGVGSTLFHTFANGLTMLMDVIPISAFVFAYLWIAMRRLIGMSRLKTIIALLVFIGSAVLMSHIPDGYRFNGSADYFPCLASLLIIGITLKRRNHPSAHWLLKAAGCFVISLTLRSADYLVCPHLPIGTHFLWHTLNGVVLYLLTIAIITSRSKEVN